MVNIALQADTRLILGKHVKQLRLRKISPLHLFGQGIKSMALQSDNKALEAVLARAGETRLIDLTVNQEKKARPVLVREVQRDALNGTLIHVDLYQVRMDEKVEVEIPFVLVGEAPVLKTKGTGLGHELSALHISCLPDKIPNKIEVDVTSLEHPGDVIRVRDLTLDPDITVLSHADQAVVIVTTQRAEAPPEVKEAPALAAEAEAKPEAERGKAE
jgi:large subunit ribosomal protein L25